MVEPRRIRPRRQCSPDAGETIASWLQEVVRGAMARPAVERDAYIAKVVKRSMNRFASAAGPDPDAIDIAHELREFGHRVAEREMRRLDELEAAARPGAGPAESTEDRMTPVARRLLSAP